MLYIIILVIFSIFLVYYHWTRRQLYAAARKLKGPPGFPLIGNALAFAGNPNEVFNKVNTELAKIDNEPVRFWLGPVLLIALKNPVYLEKLMTSPKFAYKHNIYEIIERVLGNGLVSASGLHPKFKTHRRAIQPLFDLKYLENTSNTFQKHTKMCFDRLEKHVDSKTFDIGDEIHRCIVDFNLEVILGQKPNYHDRTFNNFLQALSDMYDLGFERMVKIWLHPDFIYNRLDRGKRFKKMVRGLRDYIEEALIDSWKRRKLSLFEQNGKMFVPIIDRVAEMKELNPTLFTQDDLVDHVLTLFAAAEDPVAVISSFAVLCFGMYPQYQEKAFAEIKSVIGQDTKTVSLKDLSKLNYLDMCIRDVIRLFPIAPLILRRMIDDYQLDKWLIPKGAAVVISIYNLHRDPQYWKNPNHFHPDHFLPEEVAGRHPYSLLAFSAGPRGCIGKNVANIQLKQFLSSFLLQYEVEAAGKLPDIELKSDISVRAKNGYMCRIRKRQ